MATRTGFTTKIHENIGSVDICRHCGEGCGTSDKDIMKKFKDEHKACKKQDLGKEPENFVEFSRL